MLFGVGVSLSAVHKIYNAILKLGVRLRLALQD